MRMTRANLRASTAVLVLTLLLAGAAGARAATDTDAAPETVADHGREDWVWPVDEFRLERGYEAPAHRYGPGHRGVDMRGDPRIAVRAPASGTVAFSGSVAGRGILTIDHGEGLVTTLEPVASDLVAGAAVTRGERVATLAVGGHAPPGALHFGVRLDGEYINPMLLVDEVPRAVLLPCC
jgi:murein DD-endopeptidase MepM/ murein hydrolase activator NlpD